MQDDLSHFDKDQIIMDRRPGEMISETACLVEHSYGEYLLAVV